MTKLHKILSVALALAMSAIPLQAQSIDAAKAKVVSLITSDSDKARVFVQVSLKDMGDSSGVGDCSVFVKKEIGKTSYWVARVTLSDPSGEQSMWRAVVTEDLSYFNAVPEKIWKVIVKTGNNKLLQPRDLDPNS